MPALYRDHDLRILMFDQYIAILLEEEAGKPRNPAARGNLVIAELGGGLLPIHYAATPLGNYSDGIYVTFCYLSVAFCFFFSAGLLLVNRKRIQRKKKWPLASRCDGAGGDHLAGLPSQLAHQWYGTDAGPLTFYYSGDTGHPADGAEQGEARTINGITRYLQEHSAEEISLSVFDDEFHLSAHYISQLFKSEVGVNFLAYLTNMRTEKAKKLLSIAEVAGRGDYRVFPRCSKSRRASLRPSTGGIS